MATLTQKEADMLIDMLKKTVEKTIYFPSGKGRLEFDALGERREDVFAINISRKGINAVGATYQGRIRTGSGVVLIRLDVNPTAVHTNPDGEKISGTHIHIYTEGHGTDIAMPFDVENKDVFDLCKTFFKRFNIIEPPTVIQQITTFEV
jgi:hypothetical protein